MEERDYLYLKGTEELGDIVEIIQEFKGNEIVLVVPAQTKALSHPVNIDLLKKTFIKKRSKIFFSTEDKQISDLLKAAGFSVFLEEYETPEKLNKIVSDIIVPSKIKQKPKSDNQFNKSEKRPKTKIKFPALKWFWAILIIAAILTIFGFSLDKFTAKATITITLKTEIKDFQEIVELKPQALNNDLENQVVRGEKIILIKNHTLIVPSTGQGKGGNRAGGELTLYNSSSNSLNLVAGTRFKTSDNKIYRATKRVYIPSKDDGGKISVEIIADETGEKYNITSKTEFTIPGLSGTNWEEKIKVIAESGISGGGGGETKIVTADDIAEGKIKFEKELKELMTKEIAIKYSDYIFPENAGSINIDAPEISHRVGQATDRVVFSGKGELKTIGVKKEILVNFIKDLIGNKNLKEQANVRITELDIEDLKVMDSDQKLSYAKIQVSGKVKIKGNINTKEISQQLIGKNLENVRDILKNNPVIENAEASIWPFWNNKLSDDPLKIEIKVR